MDEPGWITFYTAAVEFERCRGVSQADAQKRLREACASEHVRTMKAPYDEPAGQLPFEFWTRVAHHEWRAHNVDYDGPDADGCAVGVMINEEDFRHWLGASKVPKQSGLSKRAIARRAAEALWPKGIPPEDVSTKKAVAQVYERLKAEGQGCIMHDDTIRRAIRRK